LKETDANGETDTGTAGEGTGDVVRDGGLLKFVLFFNRDESIMRKTVE